MKLREEELKLKELNEEKVINLRIIEANRIKDEEERIREWEIKFDEEQI